MKIFYIYEDENLLAQLNELTDLFLNMIEKLFFS